MSRIVYAEDDPDIRLLVTYKLERAGFSVIAVADGAQALRVIREEPPDVVILDVQMPGISGIDVCRRLRADDDTARVPILMITAAARPQDMDLAQAAGATGYIIKPFSPNEMVAQVRAMMTGVQAAPW